MSAEKTSSRFREKLATLWVEGVRLEKTDTGGHTFASAATECKGVF